MCNRNNGHDKDTGRGQKVAKDVSKVEESKGERVKVNVRECGRCSYKIHLWTSLWRWNLQSRKCHCNDIVFDVIFTVH